MKKTLENDQFDKLSVRAATFDTASVNEATREINLVFATENPVRRGIYTKEYGMERVDEILSFEGNAANLRRFNNNAALLDNHARHGSVLDTQIGSVRKAWIENNEGKATVRFAKHEKAEKIWQEVKDGTFTSVSVGANVRKYQVEREDGKTPVFRAIEWEAMEISITNVQADAMSSVRSYDASESEIINTNTNTNTRMETNVTPSAEVTPAAATALAAAPVVLSAATPPDNSSVRAAEIQRSAEIVEVVSRAEKKIELEEGLAKKFIEEGKTVDQVRAFVNDKFIAADSFRSLKPTVSSAVVTSDEGDKRRNLQLDALMIRAGESHKDPILIADVSRMSAAQKLTGMSLARIAQEDCRRAGIDISLMSDQEIVQRSITSSTSDLPYMLDGLAQKTLLNEYNIVSDTWRSFCAVGSLNDKRPWKRDRPGAFTNLERVEENEEIKTKKLTDANREIVQLDTYGNIINISRDMILNDDLGEITNYPRRLGRASARTIEAQVYKMLNAATTILLSDGFAVVSSQHGNTTTGVLNVDTIAAMRQLMALQMDDDNLDYIGAAPKIFVGNNASLDAVAIINGSEYQPDSGTLNKPNTVRNIFSKTISTPRVLGAGFFLFADPNELPVLMVNFLRGVQAPMMDSKEGWTVLGKECRVVMDFGVDFVDSKGIMYSTGVA